MSLQTAVFHSIEKRYSIRFIEQVKVKGKLKVVAVFEVFDGDEQKIKESKGIAHLTPIGSVKKLNLRKS